MHRSDWRYNSSARAKPKKCVVYGCKVHNLLACSSFLFFLSSIPFWLFFVPSHLPFLGRQCRAGSRGFMAGDNFDLNGLSPERAAEPTRCVFLPLPHRWHGSLASLRWARRNLGIWALSSRFKPGQGRRVQGGFYCVIVYFL